MDYVELAPPPALASVVRCIWTLTGEAADAERAEANPAYPDGSPELIFNFGDPFEQVRPDGQVVTQPRAFLVGQITRPMWVRPTGVIDLVAVRFEAHGAAELQRPMRVLNDQWRPLEDLPGREMAATLRRAFEGCAGLPVGESRTARLLGALEQASPAPTATTARVAQAVRAIRQSHGTTRFEALADELGVTTRSLQRQFVDLVGITPKMLARIVRFQHVFAAVQFAPSSLSQVALECGYCDQSHLVRDFQDFAGDAPARALAQMPEFTAFFTALRAST